MISLFKLIINETALGKLDARIQIDGKRFGEACVDLKQLKESAISSGAYDLLTCGCGEPGCAGFFEPIFVQHVGDCIHWECNTRYYPIVRKGEDIESSILRYEFDRTQYVQEIRATFDWLRRHPHRDSLGPHGFDASLFDAPFPETSSPQLPFPEGATITVGYTGDYLQPWIWVEGQLDVNARSLLASGALWSQYGYWAAMRESSIDFGLCLYRRDGSPFELRDDVTLEECNRETESLAHEIQAFWGDSANVVWEECTPANIAPRPRHTSSASEMLTLSELELLRQNGKELDAYAQKAFQAFRSKGHNNP